MKNFKIKMVRIFIVCVMFTVGLSISAQEDILFTFANSEITTDGPDSFYEVDVLMQTHNTATGSFKLGSGQLYFNYNTLAFGNNIFASSGIEVARHDSYICGQDIDAVPGFKFYEDFIVKDNTTSRVSVAFDQFYSSSTIADDNVNTTPKPLFHLKIKYVNVSEMPMVEFEDGASFDDQFFTACGSSGGGPGDSADCTNFPGIELINDTFDNGGATLSEEALSGLPQFSVYPNPTKGLLFVEANQESSYLLVDMIGKIVKFGTFDLGKNQLNIKRFDSGVYFLKVQIDSGTFVKRIVLD